LSLLHIKKINWKRIQTNLIIIIHKDGNGHRKINDSILFLKHFKNNVTAEQSAVKAKNIAEK